MAIGADVLDKPELGKQESEDGGSTFPRNVGNYLRRGDFNIPNHLVLQAIIHFASQSVNQSRRQLLKTLSQSLCQIFSQNARFVSLSCTIQSAFHACLCFALVLGA